MNLADWKAVSTPTIMDGLVVRLRLKKRPWRNEPEISASRNGVQISGVWYLMNDVTLVTVLLDAASDLHHAIKREGHKTKVELCLPEGLELER